GEDHVVLRAAVAPVVAQRAAAPRGRGEHVEQAQLAAGSLRAQLAAPRARRRLVGPAAAAGPAADAHARLAHAAARPAGGPGVRSRAQAAEHEEPEAGAGRDHLARGGEPRAAGLRAPPRAAAVDVRAAAAA